MYCDNVYDNCSIKIKKMKKSCMKTMILILTVTTNLNTVVE